MLKNYLIIAVLLVSGCVGTSDRKISSLSVNERDELSRMLSLRKDCMVREMTRLDDGRSNILQIGELVAWKCADHDAMIKRLLSDDFNISMGGVFSYTNKMKKSAPKEVAEAILASRKLESGKKSTARTVRRKQYSSSW